MLPVRTLFRHLARASLNTCSLNSAAHSAVLLTQQCRTQANKKSQSLNDFGFAF